MFQKFRKVGPKKFSKKYFLRKCFIEFPNKNIFQPTFSREKKSRNVDILAIFSLENVGRKNIFVRKFNENFSKKIFFSKKFSDQLFEIFETYHQAPKLIFFGDSHEHQPASLRGPNSTSHAVREISHILLNNNTVDQDNLLW